MTDARNEIAVKYLRDTDLMRMYSVSRSTVWRWAQNGQLPKPIHIGPGTTRWRSDHIEELEAMRASNS